MNTELDIQAALYRVRLKVKESRLHKTADNPYFNSKYIPYEDINEVINSAMAGEGLVFFQNVTHDGTHAVVTHIVQSPQGVIVTLGETKLPTPKLTPQDAGSAFTYAKRYGAAALFDLIETKDDDAEGAQQAHRQPTRVATPTPASKPASAPREGKGWDTGASNSFELKGRKWVLQDMNIKQLGTVAYSADASGMSQYPPNIIKLCEGELLKRVAANDKDAIEMVEANSQP